MSAVTKYCSKCGKPEKPDESHDFGCPTVVAINNYHLFPVCIKPSNPLDDLEIARMEMKLKEEAEKFKRENIPPQHWRD